MLSIRQGERQRESENTVSETQGLQGVHIIEGMIQLLADSLVFQLLSVQFVCRSKGRERAGGGGGSEENAELCRPWREMRREKR